MILIMMETEIMKKFIVVMAALLVSSTSLADGSYYYFKKTSDKTFHYTRILHCNSSSDVTDERFTAGNAVGPFSDTLAAREHRELAVTRAKKLGNRVKLSEGVCPTE
jgi:hypothetical protein